MWVTDKHTADVVKGVTAASQGVGLPPSSYSSSNLLCVYTSTVTEQVTF